MVLFQPGAEERGSAMRALPPATQPAMGHARRAALPHGRTGAPFTAGWGHFSGCSEGLNTLNFSPV